MRDKQHAGKQEYAKSRKEKLKETDHLKNLSVEFITMILK
jgi:hypothetical protein